MIPRSTQDSAAWQVLDAGVAKLGLNLRLNAREKLFDFARLVLTANASTNVTAPASLEDFIRRHILDSLASLSRVRLSGPAIDLGSGAGLPGIPIAIAAPRLKMLLLEPRRLRAQFLERAAAQLQLANIEVRSQSAGRYRLVNPIPTASTVLVRALAAPTAFTLALPLLRHGGVVVYYSGRQAAPDTALLKLVRQRGGKLESAVGLHVPSLPERRHLWIVRKMRDERRSFT